MRLDEGSFTGKIEVGSTKITHQKWKLDGGIFRYEIEAGLTKITHEKLKLDRGIFIYEMEAGCMLKYLNAVMIVRGNDRARF